MWRKVTMAAVLVTICTAIIVATMVPTSGAEETESIETLSTDGLVDIDISQSQPIYTGYNLDKVKESLTVTGHYSDGSTTVLNQSDFSISYDTLAAGYVYVSVIAGDIEKSIRINVTSLQPSYLKVEQIGTLFQGMSDSEIKTSLKVTLFYNDGSSKILNSDEYTVNGFTGSGTVEILITHIGSNTSISTPVSVQDIHISDLKYEQVASISSGGNLNDIIDSLDVTAVYNDGSEVDNYMNYELKSPIYIGSNSVKPEEDTGIIKAQVVLIAEGKEFPITLNITPTTPTKVEIEDTSRSFDALETFNSDRIRVTSADGTYKYVTEYTVEYYTTNESGERILTDDTVFDTDHTHVRVLYKENGVPVQSDLYRISVSPLIAEKPSFNDYPGTFGEDPSTTMTGVDPTIMDVAIEQVDGFKMVDNGDGSYVFEAVNAGTYRVTVTLNHGLGENYIWEGEDKSTRSIIFSWTVNKVGIEPSLEIDEKTHHYGDLLYDYIHVTGNTGEAGYTIYFYGQSNDGTIDTNSSSSLELTEESKLPAGVYYFYVVVDPSTNYQGATTIDGVHPSATVEKMVVPYPSDPEYEYTGNLLKPSFDSPLYRVSSDGGTTVGSYPYTVLIVDQYNYQWENNEGTYSSAFDIVQAKTNNGTMSNLDGWIYGSEPKPPTATFEFSGEGEPVIEYAIEGTEEYSEEVPVNAGTYSVRATVKETSNYVGCTVTGSIIVERQELSYTVSADDVAYNGGEIRPTVTISPNESNIYHEVKYSVPGTNVTDHPYVVLELNPNYTWNKNQTGTIDDTTLELKITISILKAENNDVVLGEMSDWTYGGEVPPKPSVTSDFGEDRVVFYYKSAEGDDQSYIQWTDEVFPTEAGNYILKAEIPDNDNYVGGSDTTSFTIERLSISAPTVTSKFTYDNTEKIVTLSGSGFKIQSGGTATYAGTHNVVVVPDSNHKWAEGEYETSPTEGISIAWSISPREVMIDGNHYDRIHTYDGNPYHPGDFEFKDLEGKIWAVQYTVSFDQTANVSSEPYHMTVSLHDDSATNYTLVANDDHEYGGASDIVSEDRKSIEIWYMIVGGQYAIEVTLNEYSEGSYGWIYDNSTTADRGIKVVVTTEGFSENDPDQKKILDIIHNKTYGVKYYSLVDGNRNELSSMPTEVGTYSLTVTIPATDAYIGAESRVDFEIKPYKIEVNKITGYEGTYDGNGHLLSGSPDVNAVDPSLNNIKWQFSTDQIAWDEGLSFTDVWSGTVYYKVSAKNHLQDTGSFTVNITPKAIDVTLGNAEASYGKTYDGAVPGNEELEEIPINYDRVQVLDRDRSDFKITLNFDDISANARTYYISASDNSENYTLNYSKIQYQINKAVLDESMFTIEVYGGKDGAKYDGDEHDSIIAHAASVVEGNNPKWGFSINGIDWSSTIPKVCNVNNSNDYVQTIYYSFTADNYTSSDGDAFIGTVAVRILPVDVTVSAKPVTVIYGNSLDEKFSETFEGLIGTDSIKGTPSFNYDYNPGKDAAEYDVVVSGFGEEGSLNGNYIVHYEPGVLKVEKRQLTVAIHDYSVEWNSDVGSPKLEPISGSIFETGVNLDNLVDYTFMTDASDSQKVDPSELGKYRIVGSVDSKYSGNYDVEFRGYLDGAYQNRDYGVLTITQISAPLTVNVSDTVYTGNPVHITVTNSEGEEVDSKLLVFTYREEGVNLDEAPVNVGSYTVYVTYNDEHYSSNNASAGYKITPATYGSKHLVITNLSPEYTGGVLLPGYVGSLQLVDGKDEDMNHVELIYRDSEGNEIRPVDVDDYAITLIFNTDNPNYLDYSTTVEFSIGPKEVEVTWNLDDGVGDWSDEQYYLVYDGVDHRDSVSASFTDVHGITVPLQTEMSSISGFKEFMNADTYSFSVGIDQGNYQIKNNVMTYTIEKRPVTIGVEGLEMEYAGEYPELSQNYLTANGFVESEVKDQLAKVSLKWASGFGPGSAAVLNVGNYEAVIMDYAGVSDNYDVASSAGILKVNPRELKVTIKDQNWAVYTGNPINVPTTYIYNPEDSSDRSIIPWVISGEVYSKDYLGLEVVTGYNDNSVGPNAGKYPITGKWSNANYDIEFTEGTFTISQADLSVKVTGYTGLYDGASHDIVSVTNNRYDITVSHGPTYLSYEEFTITYAKAGSEVYSDMIQIQHVSESGTYHFILSDPDENYKEFRGDFQVTIDQSSNSVVSEGAGKGWTYGQFVTGDSGFTEPTFTFNDADPTITYSRDGAPYAGDFNDETPAGIYVMKIVMPGNGDYTETTVEYTLVVAKAPYKLNWSGGTFSYDGSPKTNTLVYDNSIVAVGHSYGSDSGVIVTIGDGSVSMTATEGGTYYITATIVNSNYRWDGYDEATTAIEVRWTISTDENKWTTEVSIKSWTYGDVPSIPSGAAEYGRVIFTWSTVNDGGFVPYDVATAGGYPVDVGTYYLRAVVPADAGYSSIIETVQFSISPRTIAVPDTISGVKLEYSPDGTTFEITDTAWFKELDTETANEFRQYVSSINTDGSDVGSYTSLFYLISPGNCVWSTGGVDSVEVSWEITPVLLDVGILEGYSYEYTGDWINLDLSVAPRGASEWIPWFDGSTMSVTGITYAMFADQYVASLTLVDDRNYAWNLDSGLSTDSIEIRWSIVAKEVEPPAFMGKDQNGDVLFELTQNYDDESFAGGVPTLNLPGVDTSYMSVTTNGRLIYNDDGTISVEASTPGAYYITITITRDHEYAWGDNQDAGIVTLGNDVDITSKTYTWIVTGKIDSSGFKGGALEYNGDVQTYIPDWFDSRIMEITDNEGRDVSKYTLCVTPSQYYTWANGTSEPLKIEWSITPMTAVVYWSQSTFTYDGTDQSDLVSAYYVDLEGKMVPLTVSAGAPWYSGDCTFTATIPNGISNYVIAESDSTRIYSMELRVVHIVAEDLEIQYGETPSNLSWDYAAGSDLFVESDVGSAVKISLDVVGFDTLKSEFDIVVTVTGNYTDRYQIVSDNGTLSVIPKQIQLPSVGVQTYTGDTISIESLLDSEYYSYSGIIEAVDVGSYKVNLSLNNSNYVWSDTGTSTTRTLTWHIVAGEVLDRSMFQVDVSDSVYTGSPIVKNVTSENLAAGTDYVVSYTNNISVGIATITITGIGSYSDQLTYGFEIVKATPVLDFANDSLEMYIRDSSFLNPVSIPSYVSGVSYISSNPDVASVDSVSGAITMNDVGTTTITVTVSGTDNYVAAEASYELTVSETPVEVVDNIVYIRVPVTDPDDPDDPVDDKPEEPAIVYQNDNTLYIILLLVLAAVCVCFAAYIMYTHRKQEDQGGGQR